MPLAKRCLPPEEPPEAGAECSGNARDVLKRIGVDPIEHFARLLLPGSEADEKRQDEAAKQLLPYCYPRMASQTGAAPQEPLIGSVQCESEVPPS